MPTRAFRVPLILWGSYLFSVLSLGGYAYFATGTDPVTDEPVTSYGEQVAFGAAAVVFIGFAPVLVATVFLLRDAYRRQQVTRPVLRAVAATGWASVVLVPLALLLLAAGWATGWWALVTVGVLPAVAALAGSAPVAANARRGRAAAITGGVLILTAAATAVTVVFAFPWSSDVEQHRRNLAYTRHWVEQVHRFPSPIYVLGDGSGMSYPTINGDTATSMGALPSSKETYLFITTHRDGTLKPCRVGLTGREIRERVDACHPQRDGAVLVESSSDQLPPPMPPGTPAPTKATRLGPYYELRVTGVEGADVSVSIGSMFTRTQALALADEALARLRPLDTNAYTAEELVEQMSGGMP